MSRFALVAAVVLLHAAASRGDTSLRIRGDWGAEEIDLPVRDVLITSRYGDPEGTLQVGVDCLPTACTIQHWAFFFRSSLGQPLVDGVYEDTRPFSDEHPILTFAQTGGGGAICSPTGARFEIRGLVPGGPNGSLLSATIDFEAPCGNRLLFGTLHIASGDGDCVGAPDGAACDDQDPCTASEACTGERCVGERHPACDAFTCEDDDLCTVDRREAATCAHAPIAGDCWAIAEATLTASAHASVSGRSASCRLRCRSEASSVFALLDDGTYLADDGRIVAGCSGDVVVTIPAEVGRISEGRRGSLLLTPDDSAALEDALQRCVGKPLVLKDYQTRVRVAADGATLNGVSKLRYRLRDRVPVNGSEVVRFRATRRPVTPTAVARTAARARPPICSADLRPKCVQY